MKKTFLVILALFLMVTLVACGNDKQNNEDSVNNQTPISSIPTNSDDDNQNTETDDKTKIDLIYTFKDPINPVAFDYPNFKSIEEGTSQIFKNSKYVIAYCCDSGTADLKDIPNALSEKFGRFINTHIKGSFSSLNINKTEEIKINGTDVLLVKGTLVAVYDDGSTINLPMCGYTFAKGEKIYELIAILSEESNDVNQNEMEQTIEAMINTLRDDR